MNALRNWYACMTQSVMAFWLIDRCAPLVMECVLLRAILPQSYINDWNAVKGPKRIASFVIAHATYYPKCRSK